VNFSEFKLWREKCLRADPGLLNCAETNLYRALALLQPKSTISDPDRPVHRCDLARAWLRRYDFEEKESRRALICKGVRHALGLIFRELAESGAEIWIPGDVYPVYLQLARDAGIEPLQFTTMPELKLPCTHAEGRLAYMLVTNPWKPLGRFLTDAESQSLTAWLNATPGRHLLLDCVYDFGVPFHSTTRRLWDTGRTILLHSITKGWLWPKTFGVALIDKEHTHLESVFRREPPSPEHLALAENLFSDDAAVPSQIVSALGTRKNNLLNSLPASTRSRLLLDPGCLAPGCYFFSVGIRHEELLRQHRILAVPASAFGADWEGSVLTSLAGAFAPKGNGGAA
jgi:aspartate/methionine/tyrosine aminotransferase